MSSWAHLAVPVIAFSWLAVLRWLQCLLLANLAIRGQSDQLLAGQLAGPQLLPQKRSYPEVALTLSEAEEDGTGAPPVLLTHRR